MGDEGPILTFVDIFENKSPYVLRDDINEFVKRNAGGLIDFYLEQVEQVSDKHNKKTWVAWVSYEAREELG